MQLHGGARPLVAALRHKPHAPLSQVNVGVRIEVEADGLRVPLCCLINQEGCQALTVNTN